MHQADRTSDRRTIKLFGYQVSSLSITPGLPTNDENSLRVDEAISHRSYQRSEPLFRLPEQMRREKHTSLYPLFPVSVESLWGKTSRLNWHRGLETGLTSMGSTIQTQPSSTSCLSPAANDSSPILFDSIPIDSSQHLVHAPLRDPFRAADHVTDVLG